MVMIALSSSLIGAVLGTRLRVLVLFPVIMVGLALVVAVAAIKGATMSSVVGAAAVLAVCLQLGYLGGLLVRFCLAAARLTSRQPLRSPLTTAD